jgi:hypothetical protein
VAAPLLGVRIAVDKRYGLATIDGGLGAFCPVWMVVSRRFRLDHLILVYVGAQLQHSHKPDRRDQACADNGGSTLLAGMLRCYRWA